MTAKLIMKSETGETTEYELNQETVVIGRKPDNDVHVNNLSVSGKHAQIITILDDSFLEDLGSTNGTFINGKLVKKHALQHADVISLGKYVIEYNNEASTESEFEKTMIIRPGEAGMPEQAGNKDIDQSMQKITAAIAEEEKKVTPNSAGSDKIACLQLLSGANSGKELILKKALTTIGQPGIQVAAITKRPQGYFIINVDGGPNNRAPKVGGSEIGTNAHKLENHDIIEVSGVKMEFYFK